MRWRILWLTLSLSVACGLVGVAWRSLAADEPKEAQKPAEKTDKAEKADEKPKEGAKPPAVNPLQELFQKLMPQKAQPMPEEPRPGQPRINININRRGAAANGQPLDPEARDHIDARAAKDRKQSETLRKASAAAHAQDWQSALELAQNLLAQEEDSVSRVDNGWLSVREQAMRIMLKIPEQVIRGFQQRVGAEAVRRLDEAEQSGRIDRLA